MLPTAAVSHCSKVKSIVDHNKKLNKNQTYRLFPEQAFDYSLLRSNWCVSIFLNSK